MYKNNNSIPIYTLNPNNFFSKKSFSICPICGKMVELKTVEKNGFLYLKRKCEIHNGNKEELGFKIDEITKRYFWNSLATKLISKKFYFRGVKAVDVFITRKCNSNCEVCFINWTNENFEEMEIEVFKQLLKKLNNAKVVLNGGEPTTREDLEEFIKTTIESGNYPVLYTNGLKLSNINYLRKLKNAGLREVVLSFEGFEKSIYEKLRGGSYQYKLVLKALKNLEKERIKTSLYCTLVKGVNDDQIPKILRYATLHKFIWTVAFKPMYLPGANPKAFNTTHVLSYSEIIEKIGKSVEGVSVEYIKFLQNFYLKFQEIFVKRYPPIYFSWVEIPSIFVKRNGKKLSLLLRPNLVYKMNRNIDNKKQFLSSVLYNLLHLISPFHMEEILYKYNIMKIVLGIILPVNSNYIISSPSIRQINGKLYLSSYLAW